MPPTSTATPLEAEDPLHSWRNCHSLTAGSLAGKQELERTQAFGRGIGAVVIHIMAAVKLCESMEKGNGPVQVKKKMLAFPLALPLEVAVALSSGDGLLVL